MASNQGLYGELHRFIAVLAALNGAKITEMEVRHHARLHGTSKYGVGRTTRVLSDLLFMLFLKKYALKPMHLFGALGMGMFGERRIPIRMTSCEQRNHRRAGM